MTMRKFFVQVEEISIATYEVKAEDAEDALERYADDGVLIEREYSRDGLSRVRSVECSEWSLMR